MTGICTPSKKILGVSFSLFQEMFYLAAVTAWAAVSAWAAASVAERASVSQFFQILDAQLTFSSKKLCSGAKIVLRISKLLLLKVFL
jgi:hypothetical protein